MQFEREKSIAVSYKGEKVGLYKPDFLVANKVIVEIKALPFITNEAKKQLINYLKGTN